MSFPNMTYLFLITNCGLTNVLSSMMVGDEMEEVGLSLSFLAYTVVQMILTLQVNLSDSFTLPLFFL
jgi:hypothetical protein